MRFLMVDIGAGTMDVLWYDTEADLHYKAVVKSPAGELKMVGVGDNVGEKAVITRVANDHVELTLDTAYGPETLLVYIVDGGQKIHRISKNNRVQTTTSGLDITSSSSNK